MTRNVENSSNFADDEDNNNMIMLECKSRCCGRWAAYSGLAAAFGAGGSRSTIFLAVQSWGGRSWLFRLLENIDAKIVAPTGAGIAHFHSPQKKCD
jgi:hypothetical protein